MILWEAAVSQVGKCVAEIKSYRRIDPCADGCGATNAGAASTNAAFSAFLIQNTVERASQKEK